MFQLLESERVEQALSLQVLALASVQSPKTSTVYEEYLSRLFPQYEVRRALKQAHAKRVLAGIQNKRFILTNRDGRMEMSVGNA